MCLKKLFIIFSMFSCEFASAQDAAKEDSKKENAFMKIVEDFYGVNPKLRAIAYHMRALKGEQASKVLEAISVKVESKKSLDDDYSEFSTPALNLGLKVGVNTVFDMQAASAKADAGKYASEGPSVAEAEKVTMEYLKLVFDLQNKREFLEKTNHYIVQRRIDIKESDARAKYGDITVEESAEFQSNSSELEYSYTKLKAEVATLEQQVKLYYPAFKYEADQAGKQILKVPMFKLEDMEAMVDLSDPATKFTSLSQTKAMYKLGEARANLMSDITSFAPVLSFNTTMYLGENANPKKGEKDTASVSFAVNLSPSRFMDLYKSQSTYEYAKINYTWEEQKYIFDYTKLVNDLKIAKAAFASATDALRAKEISLDSAISQYHSGNILSNKLGSLRADYYHSLERYYSAKDKYSELLLEHMKLTGKIRILFIATLDKEVGGR